jgi:arginine N-succinyltransferase
MFIIRPAQPDDLPILLKFARMVHFINLPADRDALSGKIARSRKSFAGEFDDAGDPLAAREREFMFVLEDTSTGNVVGTSGLISCISWPGHPHTFLLVRKRSLFSRDLGTGQVHLTLEFGTDESGPSELGGLFLAPGYRRHAERLGTLLSLVRLHFIGIRRELFAEKVIAEMMGTLTPDSHNLLWEYLGRRFINLSYKEADLFCQHSKEFITSLFPRGEIYASLLPAEARNLIGRVGEETRPARRMLERQGFEFKDHVDPFDGGPYIEAELDRIPMVAATERGNCEIVDASTLSEAPLCIASCEGELGFRAVPTRVADGERGVSRISREAAEALGATEGDEIGWTPLSAKLDVPSTDEVVGS